MTYPEASEASEALDIGLPSEINTNNINISFIGLNFIHNS